MIAMDGDAMTMTKNRPRRAVAKFGLAPPTVLYCRLMLSVRARAWPSHR